MSYQEMRRLIDERAQQVAYLPENIQKRDKERELVAYENDLISLYNEQQTIAQMAWNQVTKIQDKEPVPAFTDFLVNNTKMKHLLERALVELEGISTQKVGEERAKISALIKEAQHLIGNKTPQTC